MQKENFMETLIITKIKNIKDAPILLSINERFGKTRILRGKEMKNFYLAKLLDDAMRSENIPLEKVHKELRK